MVLLSIHFKDKIPSFVFVFGFFLFSVYLHLLLEIETIDKRIEKKVISNNDKNISKSDWNLIKKSN